jgi:hypothetical protein
MARRWSTSTALCDPKNTRTRNISKPEPTQGETVGVCTSMCSVGEATALCIPQTGVTVPLERTRNSDKHEPTQVETVGVCTSMCSVGEAEPHRCRTARRSAFRSSALSVRDRSSIPALWKMVRSTEQSLQPCTTPHACNVHTSGQSAPAGRSHSRTHECIRACK